MIYAEYTATDDSWQKLTFPIINVSGLGATGLTKILIEIHREDENNNDDFEDCIMYADEITPSMRAAIDETERRRKIQDAYNQAHGIVPKTVIKSVRDLIEISSPTAERKGRNGVKMTKAEKEKEIARLEKQMKEAAKMMEYEYAAVLRDQIVELRGNGL